MRGLLQAFKYANSHFYVVPRNQKGEVCAIFEFTSFIQRVAEANLNGREV